MIIAGKQSVIDFNESQHTSQCLWMVLFSSAKLFTSVNVFKCSKVFYVLCFYLLYSKIHSYQLQWVANSLSNSLVCYFFYYYVKIICFY